MPLCRLLLGEGDAQHLFFFKVFGNQLHTDGKTRLREATREAHPRETGKIHVDGKDIRQIHRERVVHLLPDLPGGRRRDGGQDHIALLERLFEIPPDQRPHLLPPDVVGVVVTGGKDVGAQHDPSLHLGPEPLASGFFVKLGQSFGAGVAVSVADPVVTRQIRGGLGGCQSFFIV